MFMAAECSRQGLNVLYYSSEEDFESVAIPQKQLERIVREAVRANRGVFDDGPARRYHFHRERMYDRFSRSLSLGKGQNL